MNACCRTRATDSNFVRQETNDPASRPIDAGRWVS
jgi:hypothetical protein